eukprot:TRINITY_DN165_c0_g1_i9.p1 TRINITY_DN165_c0_g1~~TRINITY_DN165_c0_g1_i9.p1  ORF type:complete len:140 (-),score=13.70 TRINITY_DN165_c0_g1_i9:208-606(-)
MEEALACYRRVRRALDVRTREAAPLQWAARQHAMGLALTERVVGDKAANMEEALACYRRALEVRTRQATPRNWAATMWLLMVALQDDGRWAQALATARALQAFEDEWPDWKGGDSKLSARIALLEPKVEATA